MDSRKKKTGAQRPRPKPAHGGGDQQGERGGYCKEWAALRLAWTLACCHEAAASEFENYAREIRRDS